MNHKQALDILGLKGQPEPEDIKKAYRKKAMEFHPDKNPGNPAAEEKFKQISLAYEFLTKPESRQKENSFDMEDLGDLGRMFEDFFQGFNKRPQRSKQVPAPYDKPIELGDINIGIVKVNILNVLFQEPLNLKININSCCKSCLADKESWSACTSCNQTGQMIKNHRTAFGMASQVWECSSCRGKGWLRKKHCKLCKDRLIVSKEKTISAKLPKNSIGQVVRLHNTGNENWKCSDSSVMFVPQLINVDLNLLSQEELADLKKILTKAIT